MDTNETEYGFQFDIAKASIVDSPDHWIIRGIASSPSVDRDDEQMSPAAIQKMLEQINSSKIPLINEHGRKWDDRIGEVTKGSMTSDGKLMIEAKLNKKHPISQFLYDQIKKGEQFGLSVAGKVKGFTQSMRTDLGKFIRVFNDISLKEISVTSRPANWDAMGLTAKSWATEFTKSVPEEVWLATEKGETMNEDETKVDSAEAVEAPAQTTEETEAPAEDTEEVSKVKKMPKAKREQMMKAFDGKVTALRAEMLAMLDLESAVTKSSDEEEEEEAPAESTDEVVAKALKTESVAKALNEIVDAEFSKRDQTIEALVAKSKTQDEIIEKLMTMPLKRKGIAATTDAGQEAIITMKSKESTPEETLSFAEEYKRINS